MAAGLGTSFYTKERRAESKMDAGRERLPVERGKLSIWPGKEAAAQTRNQRLSVVQKRVPVSNLSFQGRKSWLASSSEKALVSEFILLLVL